MAERDGLRVAAERTLRGLEPMAERVVQAALDQVAEEYAAHLTASGRVLVAQGEPVEEADLQLVAALWWAQIPSVLAPLVAVYGAGAGAMLRWLAEHRIEDDQVPDRDHPEPPDDEDTRPDPVDRSADLVDVYLRDPETLPERVQRYLRMAENRMRDVGDDLWRAARETLAQGVAEGDDMDQLRDRLKETFAEHGNQLGDVRARRIARTEVLSAWHTAAYDEAWDMPEEDRPTVKEWISTLDTRTRAAHWRADGARVLLDEPFLVGGAMLMFPGDPLGGPENVINCFPGDTLVQMPSGLRRIYRRWYEGPLIEVHTKDGGKLSGTPNHPLLTDTGWKPMHRIEVGDKLIGAPLGELVSGSDPHVEDRPASLSEIYRAMNEARLPTWVVLGGVNFHGDAADGEVEVITADGDLCPERDASDVQSSDDLLLDGPGRRLGDLTSASYLASGRDLDGVVGKLVAPAHPIAITSAGSVRSGSKSDSLVEGHALHAQPVRLAGVAELDSGGGETVTDRSPGDAECLGQGQHRLSGEVPAHKLGHVDLDAPVAGRSNGLPAAPDLYTSGDEPLSDGRGVDLVEPCKVLHRLSRSVTLHEVINVDRASFQGHVYNLETQEGWYIANSIAAHNCRCSMVMDWDEETVPRGAGRDRGRQFLTEDEIAAVVRDFEERGIVREIEQSEVTAAAGGPHSGAMVALVPTQEDIERLAVEGGLPPEELHLTLLFLGPAEDIPDATRAAIVNRLREYTANLGDSLGDTIETLPIEGNGFAVSVFNPHGEEPCIVLGVGGADLAQIHGEVVGQVRQEYTVPEQHRPWAPHVTLTYTDDLALVAALTDRTGPIVFDRLRVAYAGDVTDIPLAPLEESVTADATETTPTPRRWHTPGDTALAFENQQTGDGRIFSPGALYWQDGPWPLQYADEMLSGHEGAELAGAIETLDRDGDRIPGTGVLYPSQPAGAQAIRLLEEGAPLGVSVDLDDVDIEFVDARPAEERDQADDDGEVVLLASLAHTTITPLSEGGYRVRATHRVEHTASGTAVRADHTVEWTTSPAGLVAGPALHAALTAAGVVTAAAGDADDARGEVLMAERAGDFLMRITRGRLRGATLVSMPAFAGARITLDAAEVTADGAPERGRMREVIAYVATSPVPVAADDVATALEMTTTQARDYLARATQAGHIVRLSRGLYVGASTLPEDRPEVVAAMSGDLELPIHSERDAEWDGDAAGSRVLAWATDGDGTVDPDRLGAAFLWRDPDRDPATLTAYKLGIADVISHGGQDRLEIVARGVFAVANVLSGGRGGVDIPEDEQDALRERVSALYRRVGEAFDERMVAPWDEDEDEMDELEASAWQEMQSLPPLPAAWFREPTAEELPPGSGGVHYADGRIYGWVAQAGVPHEAYPGRNLTIESLGDVDTTAFLRTRFLLDDGTYARVGAFTMNVGHHRDGAECETAACQWDDTRTVAGIVTVGMSEGGLWFSGAAAPWLSEWDRMVFAACQPSYHMRQERNGQWSLRAVLSVPVPGHPSKLAASAVIGRANLALTASAAPTPGQPAAPAVDYDRLAAAVVDEMERREAVRAEIERMAAELAPVRAELAANLAAKVKEGV